MRVLPLLFIFAFFTSNISFSQTDKEKAKTIAQNAIKEFDKGNYDKAIEMFDEAILLDPENGVYKYEQALSYYGKTDFLTAIRIAEPLLETDISSDVIYQLVGNSYDMAGQPDKALDIYTAGLGKYKNSGKLYLETGNVYYRQDKFKEAVDAWEQGIKAEPNYPSNYYQLAKIFAQTKEDMWALLYGEIFINLERNTERTQQISKLLYDVYKQGITLADGKIQVKLSETEFRKIELEDEDVTAYMTKIDFPVVYQVATAYCAPLLTEGHTLENLYKMRKAFLEVWHKRAAGKMPNALIAWQKKVLDRGFFEQYTYWALRDGSEKEFDAWFGKNKEGFNSFAEWMKTNKLEIKTLEDYSRTDYR